MIAIEVAGKKDIYDLARTFVSAYHALPDVMPPRISISESLPNCSAVEWDDHQLKEMICYKIILDGCIAGGIILHDMAYWGQEGVFNIGRIWLDVVLQHRDIEAETIRLALEKHPNIKKWIVRVPIWAVRAHALYEDMGFEKELETKTHPYFGWSEFEYKLIAS
jgi:hypothetical protein